MMRAGIPFSNAPGVAYEYSNYGFAILGRIVTKASGMPYRRVHPAEHPAPVRHDVDDARAARRSRRDGWRRAIGGRTSSGSSSRSCPTARSARWAAC